MEPLAFGSDSDDLTRLPHLLTTLEGLLAIPATSVRPALNQASELINETLNADKSEVFLYDETVDTLVSSGISDTPMSRRQIALGLDRLPVSNGGKTVKVFQTGASYRSGDLSSDPEELRGMTHGLGIQSALVVAVNVDGTRRGCIEVNSARPNLFTAEDERFLEAVAHWVGMVVHRTELVEQIAQETAVRSRQVAADELITILAHDLRAPLVALNGRALMLQMRAQREEHAANLRDASGIIVAANRLERMINDLMDSARLEQGIFALSPTVMDLARLARDTARTLQVQPGDIDVRASEEVAVEGDPDRIQQVLENLLTNARRFSPAGIPVQLDVTTETRADGPWAIIAVSDAGPGISEEMRPQLFTRFAAGRGTTGLGLGLYLARGIAEAHGGTLTVESEVGKGTTFRLALPQTIRND